MTGADQRDVAARPGTAARGMMTAARAHTGAGRLRLEEVPVPALTAGETLVAVEAAGVSRGLVGLWRFTDRIPLPVTLGHEIAGAVHTPDPAGGGFTPGARVRIHAPIGCGTCRACRAEDETGCAHLSVIGYGVFGAAADAGAARHRDGGLAPFVRVPTANLDALPPSLDAATGCKLGTVAAVLRGLRLARSRAPGPGPIVVTGATGACGTAAVACAPVVGFHRVVAVASRPGPLGRLRGAHPQVCGSVATDELPPGWQERQDLRDAVLRHTGGEGAAAVLDLTPLGGQVAAQALRAVRRGGALVAMAGNPAPLPVSLAELMASGWQVLGSDGAGRSDVRLLLDLVRRGRVRLDGMVTHRFPLQDVHAALDAVMDRTGDPVFVVVDDLHAHPDHDDPSAPSARAGPAAATVAVATDQEIIVRTPQDVFDANDDTLTAEPGRVADLTASYQFDILGEDGGSWALVVEEGRHRIQAGSLPSPDVVVTMEAPDFVAMGSGELDGQSAFMDGRMRVRGDIGLAIRLADIFG